jgi:sugar lactone lactonase YvrE
MNKFRFICFIGSLFLVVFLSTKISLAQITDPIVQPIEKSALSVALKEIAQIPNSGTDREKAARLNILTHAGDGSKRLFVNDMRGNLYVIVDGTATVYLNLKRLICDNFTYETDQQGFAYFAFHPEFAKNGIFYTATSETQNSGIPDFPVTKTIIDRDNKIIESSHHDVIREWKATDPSSDTFAGTSREILRIEQPYPDHNVGQLSFNPNAKPGDDDYGLLYIAVAGGGSDGFPVSHTDPLDNGQDLGTPLGKILRVNPLGNNSTNGQYGIPSDNPFVADKDPKTLGEIWTYGLRNPHRFSWDTGGKHKMLIADIGQAFIEEVNLGIKGANYGWGNREGTWVVDEKNEKVLFPLPSDDAKYGYTYPVAQYSHHVPKNYPDFYGITIAGGYVYRGKAIPELAGQYIFADFGSDGRFFHAPVDELVNGKQAKIKELRLFDRKKEATFLQIIGKKRSDVRFGVDEDGEIYVTSKQDGKVRKLVPSPESPNYQNGHNSGNSFGSRQVLMGSNGKVEKVSGGFKFTEGPVWHPSGFLLFSDIPANTIYKWTTDGKISIFRRPAGNPNGNTQDREGRLITAQHNRQLTRTEKNGKVTVLAERYQGKHLNSPNDVVVKSDGSIYFTDPPYGIKKEQEELGFYGIYRWQADGTLSLLNKEMVRPNGIAFSPDENKLYVSDSEKLHIRVFDVKTDGTLTNSKVFAELPGSKDKGVPDGMKVDVKGNIYCSGSGGVWIFSPTGQLLDKIAVPESVTNLAWGNKDYKTLYITAGESIYCIHLNTVEIQPGKAPIPQAKTGINL